jgi:hypothetical protein
MAQQPMLNGLCIRSSRSCTARQASSYLLDDFCGYVQINQVRHALVILQLGGVWDASVWMFGLECVDDAVS